MVLAPNLSGLRRYSPICPRQMHGIPPLLLGKLEAYSVLESMYLWLHITWITKESSQRRVLGQYMSLGRF